MSMKPTLCNYGITYLIIIFLFLFSTKGTAQTAETDFLCQNPDSVITTGPILQIPTVIQHAIGKQATDMCASGTNSCLVM